MDSSDEYVNMSDQVKSLNVVVDKLKNIKTLYI